MRKVVQNLGVDRTWYESDTHTAHAPSIDEFEFFGPDAVVADPAVTHLCLPLCAEEGEKIDCRHNNATVLNIEQMGAE